MKLYEIDQAIIQCFDPETGELLDEAKLDELQMEKQDKIRNAMLLLKNLTAEKEAVRAEKESFASREKSLTGQIERLKGWLTYATDGNPQSFTEGKIVFRKSEETVVDLDLLPKKWLKKKISWDPDKVAIKNAIKAGIKIKGASVVEKLNLGIK